MSESKDPNVYIGRYSCGCDLAVCLDSVPKRSLQQHISEWIADGASVRMVTWAQWKDGSIRFGHVCGLEPKARTT
jgi:hypothetical protein